MSLGSKYASSATVIVILLHRNVSRILFFLTFLVFSDKISLQFVFSHSNSRLYSRLCQLQIFSGGILVALIQFVLLLEDSFSVFNPLRHNVPKWSYTL